MTHTSTEQPEALALADLRHLYQQMVGGGVRDSLQARRIAEGILSRAIRKLEASQAQRGPLSEHKQALDFLAGLHPGITIDGPPMAIAELIFDAVQADQRALKDEIAKQERNLDWMRKELAKRASGHTQEKR